MGNETPNTPNLSETALREMPMDALRQRARDEGIEGADDRRREELVEAISRKHAAGGGGGGARSSDGDQGGGGGGAGPSGGGGGNETPNTPQLSETDLREMPMDELRQRARDEGVDGADSLHKEALVDAISRKHRGG